MQYTENIDLLKPDENEQYDIDHFNRNADTIDGHIHDLETGAESLRADMEAGDTASRQFSNMAGTCRISQGGTGKTTAQEALDALHSDVSTEETLSDVDEVLFMRRTQEDVTQGIPESISVKNVLVEKLAEKIFQLMDTGGAGRFTATNDGFAPKSGNADATKFLNASGQWTEPQGRTTVHEVTASQNIEPDASTIVRIKANATVLVRDPSGYGESLVLSNETARAQLVSIRLKSGSVSYKLNKGRTWRLMWNGSFWIPQFDEPQCGDVKSTYADTAPEGWFLCDGRDTTGTADELETCYPYLYELVGGNILPDLRECTLVGAGRNTRDSIENHDEYTIGQFKDDQFRNHTHSMGNHTHTRGTMEITGMISSDLAGLGVGVFSSGSGAFSVNAQKTYGLGMFSGPADIRYFNANFVASRAWTGATSGPSVASTGGANESRGGTVTRGKRKGVNFIIKA